MIKQLEGSMGSKKKILVAGIGQSNFLKQLYLSIQKASPGNYEFDIYGLNEISGKDEYGIEIFGKIYRVRKGLLIGDFKHILDKKLVKLVFDLVRYGLTFGRIKKFIKKYLITKSQFKEFDLGSYDIIHIHFPTYEKLNLYWHIPSHVKCVVSFWGSDLMRTSGVFNYFIQEQVLNRADIITIHGNELKQQILTKFGRNLNDKILFTRFPPFDHLYTLIEEKIKEPKANFEAFYNGIGIPEGKTIVVIGHNGTPDNNHLKIIKALNGLSAEVKDKSFFILPFSYKASQDGAYEAECLEALKSAGLQGKLLKKFLPWEELAIFKRITDIMIHMPVSDALSGAMTEALFAGTKVITANWLPYSPFVNEGLVFKSTDFENLEYVFSNVFAAQTEEENVVLNNREIIKSKFLSCYCASTWLPVFN